MPACYKALGLAGQGYRALSQHPPKPTIISLGCSAKLFPFNKLEDGGIVRGCLSIEKRASRPRYRSPPETQVGAPLQTQPSDPKRSAKKTPPTDFPKCPGGGLGPHYSLQPLRRHLNCPGASRCLRSSPAPAVAHSSLSPAVLRHREERAIHQTQLLIAAFTPSFGLLPCSCRFWGTAKTELNTELCFAPWTPPD